MPGVVITNPVINSPFDEPARHYFINDQGITDKILPMRRTSAYFVPIARSRSRNDGQQTIEDWTGDRIEENPTINRIRAQVRQWRERRYTADTTRVTACRSDRRSLDAKGHATPPT
jgi:type III restriction enzyme